MALHAFNIDYVKNNGERANDTIYSHDLYSALAFLFSEKKYDANPLKNFLVH